MEADLYPPVPHTGRAVSGGTAVGDVVNATATTVSATRSVTPIFRSGSAGLLVWTIEVVADRGITGVDFVLTAAPQIASVSRGGPAAAAVLQIVAGDAPATLRWVATCPVGTVLTVTEKWAQIPRAIPQVVLAEPGFGDMSVNGAPVPPPSVGLSAREALSPARRSPQVRAAQRIGARRPDLLARASSLI